MNTGDHVAVSFISENRTEFSGIHFAGNGIIDRLEDNRVFGHLYSGQPFMCDPTDVSVNVDIHNLDKYYQLGFVLVPKELTHEQAVKVSDDENFFETYQTILTESDTSEDSAAILIQTAHKAMIKAQEPAND